MKNITEKDLERFETVENCLTVTISSLVSAVIEGDQDYIETLNSNIQVWLKELNEFNNN